jgi:threonine aldolase
MLGGGMRQVGILAAAGLIALEESPKRLVHDHENAQYLAKGLAAVKRIALDPARVVTNIVIFDVHRTGRTAAEICEQLAVKKVLCSATEKHSVRMVTHCDVDRAGIDAALAAVAQVLNRELPAAAVH